MCAVLYDEEKCKRSSSYLSLRSGDSGVLPLITTGLRRNDVEVIQAIYHYFFNLLSILVFDS